MGRVNVYIKTHGGGGGSIASIFVACIGHGCRNLLWGTIKDVAVEVVGMVLNWFTK
jgi:hypothetical protein